MQYIFMILLMPFKILNVFGGILSGVWIAMIGEWWAIGFGLLFIIFLFFALKIFLMFAVPLMIPGYILFDKGYNIIAIPFVFLAQFYISALITVWCLLVFFIFMTEANQETFWPLLIWSYGIALGPWMYMTQMNMQSGIEDFSFISTFFGQVAYIAMSLIVIFRSGTLIELAIVFGSIMLIAALVQTGVAFALQNEKKKLGSY